MSIFCLVTLLTRNLVPAQVFRAVYDQLIPPIKTCLGDDDSTTRKWSCQLLTAAFNLIQGRLTGEEASDMYHDLVKRLDDSNNCLLYTSPSPRDGLLSRMPSSA